MTNRRKGSPTGGSRRTPGARHAGVMGPRAGGGMHVGQSDSLAWQPWVTYSGVSGTPIVTQPSAGWLDLGDSGPVQIETSITQIAGGVTLVLQTAAEAEGPWFDGQAYAALTRGTVVLDSSPYGADISQIQRFVRWQLRVPAATWNLTFRSNVDLSPGTHIPVSAARAAKLFDSGYQQHEMQPWFAVRGGICIGSPGNEQDAFYQSETHWLDTSSIENLVIESQVLMMSGVTLVIEAAMSKEGPWSTVAAIDSAYALTTHMLSKEPGTDFPMRRYLRWHLEGDGATTNWQANFRISSSWC